MYVVVFKLNNNCKKQDCNLNIFLLEGDLYEIINEYIIIIYYWLFGSWYDWVVGFVIFIFILEF